jgi:hypothetical protein
VTLKSSEGQDGGFVAGPDVRNLEQVKKGDVVTIEYAGRAGDAPREDRREDAVRGP